MMMGAEATKDQVLELYLNRVYMSAGIYGVEAMSRKLFVKKAKDLNVAEAALLAGLIRAPSALSPWSNIDGAIERSNVVLRRMREEGYITERDEEAAHRAGSCITSARSCHAPLGYAQEFLRPAVPRPLRRDQPSGFEVHTSFVPVAPGGGERRSPTAFGSSVTPKPGRVVALDPGTGNILALCPAGSTQRVRFPTGR